MSSSIKLAKFFKVNMIKLTASKYVVCRLSAMNRVSQVFRCKLTCKLSFPCSTHTRGDIYSTKGRRVERKVELLRRHDGELLRQRRSNAYCLDDDHKTVPRTSEFNKFCPLDTLSLNSIFLLIYSFVSFFERRGINLVDLRS